MDDTEDKKVIDIETKISDSREIMQRAKRLAMVLHMVIFDRGEYIEFRTWKRKV